GAARLDMSGRLGPFLRDIAAVEWRTPCHRTGIGRVVAAIERLTHDRAHAVGADHDLGLDASAVGESEQCTVVALLEPGEAVPEMNGAMIEPACERVEQVGAVKGVIGGAVSRGILSPIVEFEKLAGLHVARVDAGRCRRNSGDLIAETDRLQRFDRLRTDIDRSADLAQGRCSLEDLRLYAESPQRMRSREPGEATADNGYPTACLHAATSHMPRSCRTVRARREDLSQANATCIERLAHDTFWSGIEGLDAGRSSARTAALRRTRHPRECQYGRKAALDMPAHPAQAVPRRCDDLHHQRHLHWTRAR